MLEELKTTLEAVKDQNLTRSQLEAYRDTLTNLFAQIHLELADKEKLEALYFLTVKAKDPSLTDIAVKRMWNGSADGQRLIDLKHYSKATEKMLSSLKSRIYAIY